MKFTPSSMARCKARTDSSSCAPIHPDPPMPHAPYPISETDRPVLPSGRYCTFPPAPATAPAAAKRFSSWVHPNGTPFIRFSYPRSDIDTYQAGSSPLAASGRPTGRSRGRDMGLFRRSKHTTRTSRKPTLRERRAAERTARAEASLVETEQKIHQIADEVRGEIKDSA